MIFSFIISANNNIKRIQLIIGRICDAIGESTPYGKAFPTTEAMASVPASFFAEMGAGYRAQYLYDTAQALKNYPLSELKNASTKQAREMLLRFKGIGPKVADCICFSACTAATFFQWTRGLKRCIPPISSRDTRTESFRPFSAIYSAMTPDFASNIYFIFKESMDKRRQIGYNKRRPNAWAHGGKICFATER